MNQFVEIVDREAVILYCDVMVEGISASSEEWKKHNIYPNNGVVAQIIGEGVSKDGKILLLQCLDDFFVPILPFGVKYISESEFWKRLPQNLIIGQDLDKKNESAMIDSIMKNLFDF